MAVEAKFNPIDHDKIVREQIKRELRSQQLAETFTFNPRSTFYMTEKPNYVTQDMFETDEGIDPELLDKATVAALPPKKKYDFPVTEAQEIGWHAHAPLVPPSTRFTFRSRQSEMTKHANAVTEAHWDNIRK